MTPDGKLQKGDILMNDTAYPDVSFEVVERLGDDTGYSVKLRRTDGQPMPLGINTVYRTNRNQFFLLTAAWKIKHEWRYVP